MRNPFLAQPGVPLFWPHFCFIVTVLPVFFFALGMVEKWSHRPIGPVIPIYGLRPGFNSHSEVYQMSHPGLPDDMELPRLPVGETINMNCGDTPCTLRVMSNSAPVKN